MSEINQIIKCKREGYWEIYYDNDKIHYKGNFLNGIRHGYWESYYKNGFLCYKVNFFKGNYIDLWINDNKVGLWFLYSKGLVYKKEFYS
jgi:antitoxin component YwqK of YwqJK toxin-antitoxin module